MNALPKLILLLSVTGLSVSQGLLSAHGATLDQDDVTLVDSVGSNQIYFHRNTASVVSLTPLIIDRIKLAVREIGEVVPVEEVAFRVLVFPERTLPEKGISGVAPNGEQIYLLLDPDHPRLQESITDELVATIAHEYHHTLRKRTVGFGSTLFEAIISEGLAEHFCMEVTGEDPPWANQIPAEELAPWRARAEREWFEPEFNYYAWFVGIGTEFPRGTGYSIGRSIIAEYLAAHPGVFASTLYSTPASEFRPRKKGQLME